MKNSALNLLLCGIILCANCTRPASKLQKISLGEQKSEIVKKIGHPDAIRGAIRNKFGQKIEVWEYRLSLPSDDSAGEVVGKSVLTVFTLGMGAMAFSSEKRDYWLYFHDGELVRWNQAGDWQAEAKNLYEIRFTSGQHL